MTVAYRNIVIRTLRKLDASIIEDLSRKDNGILREKNLAACQLDFHIAYKKILKSYLNKDSKEIITCLVNDCDIKAEALVEESKNFGELFNDLMKLKIKKYKIKVKKIHQ